MSRKSRKKNSRKKKNVHNETHVPFGIKQPAKHPKYIRNEKFDEKLFATIFKHPDNKKYQHEFPKYIFEPNIWGQYNKEYKTNFQPSKIKGMRILIQISSIHAILTSKYYTYNNIQTDNDEVKDSKTDENKEQEEQESKTNYKVIKVARNSIIESVSKTVMHYEQQLFADNFFEPFINTNSNDKCDEMPTIMVMNEDMLDVSKYIMEKYHLKPLVLVMSSKAHPGGGYRKGAGAQEEDMCRRSTLFCNLEDPYNFRKQKKKNNNVEKWSYPLPEFGGIYSPNVLVFRNGINNNYSFYDHPLKMSFVSGYAYSSPNLDSNNRLSKTMVKRYIKKIETILRIGMLHKHKCLVLSAIGCGAYENPPLHIAELFKRVIMKDEYRKYFTMIVFAIIDDKNTKKAHNPNGNVKPFADVFKVPISTINE